MVYYDTHIITPWHKRDRSRAILIYFLHHLLKKKHPIENQHEPGFQKPRCPINFFLVVSLVSYMVDRERNLLFHHQDQRFMQFNLQKYDNQYQENLAQV